MNWDKYSDDSDVKSRSEEEPTPLQSNPQQAQPNKFILMRKDVSMTCWLISRTNRVGGI